VDLFGRTFRYEDQAAEAIRKAKTEWSNIEDVLMALEWGLMHAPEIGRLLNERGLRGFTFPGARSLNEPDIDVLYVATDTQIIVEGLIFRQAKAHYAGTA
jgi:hypothetical protein